MTPADVADAAWALRRARELARIGYPPLPRPVRRRAPIGAVSARFAPAVRPAAPAPAPRGQAALPLGGSR